MGNKKLLEVVVALYESFHKNGKLLIKSNLKNNKRDGECLYFWPNELERIEGENDVQGA